MSSFKDLTGNKYNRLEVLYRVENHKGRTAYMCRCDCGNKKVILSESLKRGHTKSCGCYDRERRRFNKGTHTYVEYEDHIEATNQTGVSFKFDIDDFEKVDKYYWTFDKIGYLICIRKQDDGSTENLYLHRLLIGEIGRGLEVDHINGDTFDNRKCNLRTVTKSQNQMNCDIPKDNKSGVRGVAYIEQKSRWKAYICKNRVKYNLGYFKNKQDAIDIREEFEYLLFGEYSRKHEHLKEKFKHIEDFDTYIKEKYPKLYAKHEEDKIKQASKKDY